MVVFVMVACARVLSGLLVALLGAPVSALGDDRPLALTASYGVAASNADIVGVAGGMGTSLMVHDNWGVLAMARVSAGLGAVGGAASVGACAYSQISLCMFGAFLQARVLRTYWISPWRDDWYAGAQVEALAAIVKIGGGIFWPIAAFDRGFTASKARFLISLTVGIN